MDSSTHIPKISFHGILGLSDTSQLSTFRFPPRSPTAVVAAGAAAVVVVVVVVAAVVAAAAAAVVAAAPAVVSLPPAPLAPISLAFFSAPDKG